MRKEKKVLCPGEIYRKNKPSLRETVRKEKEVGASLADPPQMQTLRPQCVRHMLSNDGKGVKTVAGRHGLETWSD